MIKKLTLLPLVFAFAIACVGNVTEVKTSQTGPHPYLSQVTKNSIVISIKTAIPLPIMIEYGTTPAYGMIVKEAENNLLHRVTITGLEPATTYHYRISAGGQTEDFSFRTAVPRGLPFDFDVYGDTRTNTDEHIAVLKQIEKTNPLFIINSGDLVDSDRDIYWNDYFSAICEKTHVGENFPIYATVGNHDGIDNKELSLYFRYLSLPSNNPAHSSAYYSFNCGDGHFISLDSYLSLEPGSAQYAWLIDDLKTYANRKWKFVFMHVPLYSSGLHGSDVRLRKILAPVFEQYGVALVFSGHDHLYERTKSIGGVTYIVSGGGGAPLYNLGPAQWMAAGETVYHFCRVHIEGNHCTMQMVRVDGTIGDTLLLQAPL
jgi:predicted phosphodiesterase